MNNIGNNQSLELLDKDNDMFNLLPKATALNDFMDSYYSKINPLENKMIALYGDWGSGKTTIMKFIKKQLDNTKFKTIFFEAWKFEKDKNLSFSLIDVMTSELDSITSKKVIKNILTTSYSLFKIISSGITVKVPALLDISLGNILENMDSKIEKDVNDLSYYKKINDFEMQFKKLEDELVGKSTKMKTIRKGVKTIVFIDDLDRCEPENALSLLTDIKHFMTLGDRTIFFIGIDKNAINNAIKAKYDNYIKSDEYLEKIFDFTFEISNVSDSKAYIDTFFKDDNYKEVITDVHNLFKYINFNNPRHVKKIFNKFAILKTFLNSSSEYSGLVPELNNINKGTKFNVILVIYFIILYE
ncbi:MAG: P-loop NTPase fold protein, partial [Bacteroidales bacterium]|nr:P-loop NTPase fold protein [Bacteroidales bacterium]